MSADAISAFRELHVAREASLSNDLASARAELSRVRVENEMLRKNLHEQQMELMRLTTESQSAVIALKLRVEQLTTINSEYRAELNDLRNNKSLSDARIDAAREVYLKLQRTAADQAELLDKAEYDIRNTKKLYEEEIEDIKDSVRAFIKAVSMQVSSDGSYLADDTSFQMAMDVCFRRSKALSKILDKKDSGTQATILQTTGNLDFNTQAITDEMNRESKKRENFQAAIFSRLITLSKENKAINEQYTKLLRDYEEERERYNNLKTTVDRTLSTVHKNGVMAPAVTDLLSEIAEKNDEIERLRKREKEFKERTEKAESATVELEQTLSTKNNEINLLKTEFKEIEALRATIKNLLNTEITD